MAEYLNIHTHKPGGEGLELVNIHSLKEFSFANYASFGLHPWDIEKADASKTIGQLENFCIGKKIVAVGEIGLDRAIKTPIEIQQKYFIEQVDIANEFSLPVIIHSVKANTDLLQLRKNLRSDRPWIFHGFKGSLQEARQLIDKQCYLSFGKTLLNHKKNQHVMQNISLDHIFFETDNSDEKISVIYKKAGELLDICIEELKEKIYSNFINVFGLQ